VPALQYGRRLDLNYVIGEAKRRFDLQLATALQHPLRQPDRSVKSWGDSYAAFHCVEYGQGPSQEELDRAWAEIETSLRNLFGMTDLLERLRRAQRLVAQRSLQYSACGVNVAAVPDLIAFFSNDPPIIVDWKAHIVGTIDAWLQLAIYSIALKRCNPHKDFPASLVRWPVEAIGLVEVQLLLNRIRHHDLDDDDRDAAEAYVAESANSMLMAVNGKKTAELAVEDFATASFDGTCERCSFRKACWETLQ
jgi:hypothetical protein